MAGPGRHGEQDRRRQERQRIDSIQTEHAEAAYEAALARSRKIGELLTDLSRDAVKSMVADAEQTKAPVKPLSVAKRLQAAE